MSHSPELVERVLNRWPDYTARQIIDLEAEYGNTLNKNQVMGIIYTARVAKDPRAIRKNDVPFVTWQEKAA